MDTKGFQQILLRIKQRHRVEQASTPSVAKAPMLLIEVWFSPAAKDGAESCPRTMVRPSQFCNLIYFHLPRMNVSPLARTLV